MYEVGAEVHGGPGAEPEFSSGEGGGKRRGSVVTSKEKARVKYD
jgi:hypothetical protein